MSADNKAIDPCENYSLIIEMVLIMSLDHGGDDDGGGGDDDEDVDYFNEDAVDIGYLFNTPQ